MAKKDDELLSTARSRLETASAAWSDTRHDELEDLKFAAGSPANQLQWPQDVLSTRGAMQGQSVNARPCLTMNRLPQHIKQVTNDQRQNRPSGKVIPVDDNGDVEVAEVLDGIVKHIEYISDADVAYDTACENQVTYGEGYIRLLTEYCDDDSFNQDIKIGRIRNSFSVYMDPMIQDPCGQDAQWAFITEDILHDEYERKWPDATPVSSIQTQGVGDQSLSQWVNDKTVRIAEYFYYENTRKTLNLWPGNVSTHAGTPEDELMKSMYGGRPARSRSVEIKQVKWCKINGYEVLESSDWVGKYIPIVRVIGNEFEVDGRIYISGIVRNAIDAQRLLNYWTSQEAEMLALAPKAPFIAYGGQFEGYEQQWKTANVQNWPYLEVNPDVTDGQGRVLPLPQRSQPPMAQTGLIQAKMGAAEDIKATTGQYDSSLGATSNERSGKAIMARERQADTGTYHYVDNLARAIRYLTRQIVDMIPKIYDTERVARIIGADGETGTVKINPMQQEAVKKITDPNNPSIVIEKIYNPGVGRYDVCVTTGPSYMTKRQESLDAMSEILKGNPEMWAVAGDLFVKHMDWPGAQEMAARMRKTMDPKLFTDDDESPELQAAKQEMEQMAQQMEQMHQMLKDVPKSMEAQELRIKEFEANIREYEAETKRISAVQASMSPDQIQDIVMGTLAAALQSGDLAPPAPEMMPEMQPQMAPPMAPDMGMPQ